MFSVIRYDFYFIFSHLLANIMNELILFGFRTTEIKTNTHRNQLKSNKKFVFELYTFGRLHQ